MDNLTIYTKLKTSSSSPYSDDTVVLSKTDTVTGKVYFVRSSDDGTLQTVQSLTFDTGILDPVAVSMVPNTPDFVFASSDKLVYFAFDDSSGTYIQDSTRSISGLSGVIGISNGSNGVHVLTSTSRDYYLPLDTGGYDKVTLLSENPILSSVSISANTGSYDYARLLSDGTVKYYTMDDVSGSYVEVPQLTSIGNTILNKYISPKNYQSITLNSAGNFNALRITTVEQIDPNTTITYQYSLNGGVTWTSITPNTWVDTPDSNNVIVRATLSTSDGLSTPKLLRIVVEVTKLSLQDLTINALACPPDGQVVPTTAFPVRVKAGAEVAFQVTTKGFAAGVVGTFTDGTTVNMNPAQPVNLETNLWTGTYVVPPNSPNGTLFQAIFTAQSGISANTVQLPANPFIVVEGSILENVNLMLTQ